MLGSSERVWVVVVAGNGNEREKDDFPRFAVAASAIAAEPCVARPGGNREIEIDDLNLADDASTTCLSLCLPYRPHRWHCLLTEPQEI